MLKTITQTIKNKIKYDKIYYNVKKQTKGGIFSPPEGYKENVEEAIRTFKYSSFKDVDKVVNALSYYGFKIPKISIIKENNMIIELNKVFIDRRDYFNAYRAVNYQLDEEMIVRFKKARLNGLRLNIKILIIKTKLFFLGVSE